MQLLLPPKQIALQLIERAEPKESVENKGSDQELTNLRTLPERVKEANRNNVLFTEVRGYLTNPKDHDRPNIYLRGS